MPLNSILCKNSTITEIIYEFYASPYPALTVLLVAKHRHLTKANLYDYDKQAVLFQGD